MCQRNEKKKLNRLENLRDKPLRVVKGTSQKIMADPLLSKTIPLWLDLKSLYSSSVIFNDNGKRPYKLIAEFEMLPTDSIRKTLKKLENIGLVWFENKNLYLASYEKFCAVLKIGTDKCKYKYNLKNDGNIKFKLQLIAEKEKLKEKDFQKWYNIALNELGLLSVHKTKQRQRPMRSYDRDLKKYVTYRSPEDKLIRKKLKHINQFLDHYENKYQNIFNQQMNQIEFGYPGINPNVTLSYREVAKLFGKSDSPSTGYYIQKKLENLGYIAMQPEYLLVNSPVTKGEHYNGRQDTFRYTLPLTAREHRRINNKGSKEEMRDIVYSRSGKLFKEYQYIRLPNKLEIKLCVS